MKKELLVILLLFITTETLMAKKPLAEITQALSIAKQKINVGGVYFHHRNPTKLYKIISLSINTSKEDEILVNYQSFKNPNDIIWTRPLQDFLSIIQINDVTVPKFNQIILADSAIHSDH